MSKEGRRPAFFIDPHLPGSVDPKTGRQRTFVDHQVAIVELCEFLHENHGAKLMNKRHLQEYVVKQYRSCQNEDIEEFWARRPDMKPIDWEENIDVYMNAHRVHWQRLAWDAESPPADAEDET